ncbi:MAG: DNA-formamidopyrimidine glycosylase family protein [Promethearchaeota archaeon]|jgi:formamidopyrimidine-DNA glycosylase
MSIELPEAYILASQMNEELEGKKIKSYDLKDVERMKEIGFVNKNLIEFNGLIQKTIISASSRGNTIRVKLNQNMNLLIGPEYGGKVLYHEKNNKIPKYHIRLPKYHIRLDFNDNTSFTVRITSMGIIYVVKEEELNQSYLYSRDFLKGISPKDEEFTFQTFYDLLNDKNKQLKPLLVGKNAYLVGLSNAAFQDILYRASIHPKRKASNLTKKELNQLYISIKLVIEERLKLKGKHNFIDLYGNPGQYIPAMGPNMKDKNCPNCGSKIEKISHGGGQVYLCPSCQKQ